MKYDIILTTYKRPKEVLDALRSCLSQGQLLSRVIVVDDASKDGTAQAVAGLRDPRILYYERPINGGIAAARQDALVRSTADWSVQIDSDHELLPGALDHFEALRRRSPEGIGIMGGRYRWDTGRITPAVLPPGPIDYVGRIVWSAKPDSIGEDYVCALSRSVREQVKWEAAGRADLCDALFQLDAAKISQACFTPECVALEKSDAPEGYSRGKAKDRFARRCKDAASGVHMCQLLLERHGNALQANGPKMLGAILQQAAFFAVLAGQRRMAYRWLFRSMRLRGITRQGMGLLSVAAMGRKTLKCAYLIRG